MVNMNAKPVIQVVSDVVCPWCYVGKRRLEKALDLIRRKDITVRWTAFQLNPNAPPEGWNRREYRVAKFGSAEVSARLETRVAEAGRQDDIHFRFDRIEKTPNTFDAHRLIWLSAKEGVHDAAVENLFRAYFIEGRNIADRAVLRDVGNATGLTPDGLNRLFESNLGAAEVSSEEAQARSRGVSGVPTFFLNGEELTSGAHPAEALAAMLTAFIPRAEAGEAVCSVDDGTCD
jgi:predicted DsbA family dithiol-disulfide isomerase